jgi:hypothetical protein
VTQEIDSLLDRRGGIGSIESMLTCLRTRVPGLAVDDGALRNLVTLRASRRAL